jgi:GNAT superfamily N-acetyltransferase
VRRLDELVLQGRRRYVSKALVHRRARRRGLGAVLTRAVEATARECGDTLLGLDPRKRQDHAAAKAAEEGEVFERLTPFRSGGPA